MACWDSRPGGPLRLPRLLAIAPGEHGRGRFGPRASAQSHERDASAVALLPLPQDHGSVGSAMAVTCSAFARRPPSYFRLPQSQQNIEDVVAPFRLPCPQGIGASLTKYVANGALPHPTRQSISATRESEIRSRRKTMTKKLDGKIALVTGGSRGIGAAIAKRLAA